MPGLSTADCFETCSCPAHAGLPEIPEPFVSYLAGSVGYNALIIVGRLRCCNPPGRERQQRHGAETLVSAERAEELQQS